jgi:hypothetical protein
MLQGECALDAENIVKLFTMDMVDQQKVEEYVYEMALQVTTDCLAVSAPCGSIRQPAEAAAGLRGRSQCWWSRQQQRHPRTSRSSSGNDSRTGRSSSTNVSNGMLSPEEGCRT